MAEVINIYPGKNICRARNEIICYLRVSCGEKKDKWVEKQVYVRDGVRVTYHATDS